MPDSDDAEPAAAVKVSQSFACVLLTAGAPAPGAGDAAAAVPDAG
jgi:hypothetical protein